jgi:hypothetical protein
MAYEMRAGQGSLFKNDQKTTKEQEQEQQEHEQEV